MTSTVALFASVADRRVQRRRRHRLRDLVAMLDRLAFDGLVDLPCEALRRAVNVGGFVWLSEEAAA